MIASSEMAMIVVSSLTIWVVACIIDHPCFMAVNRNIAAFGAGTGRLSTDQKKKLLWGNKKSNPSEEVSIQWMGGGGGGGGGGGDNSNNNNLFIIIITLFIYLFISFSLL